MAGLTPADIADLSRWHAIQFRDRTAVEEALARHERYLRRLEREHAGRDATDSDRYEGPTADRAA